MWISFQWWNLLWTRGNTWAEVTSFFVCKCRVAFAFAFVIAQYEHGSNCIHRIRWTKAMFKLTDYNTTPKPILISMNTHCLSISVYCHCSPCRYSSRSRYRGLSVWTHLYCKCRIVTDTDVLTTIKNMSAKLLVWVALLSRTRDSKTSRQRSLSPTDRQGSLCREGSLYSLSNQNLPPQVN